MNSFRRWSILAGLLLVGVALAVGLRSWRTVTLERQIASACELLRGEHPLDEVRATIRLLQDHPAKADELKLLEAGVALREGDAAEALELLTRIRPQGKFRADALLLWGEALLQQGRLSEAQARFQTVVQERPELRDGHRWLALIFQELGAVDSALHELQELARLDPDNFLPYRLQGQIYGEDLNRFEQAVANYEHALERHPPAAAAAEIRRELARFLILDEQYGRALEVLQQAPQGAVECALLAECQWGLGDADAARETLARLAAIDPDHRALRVLAAVIEIEQGTPQTAVELLRRHLDREPHDFVARHQLSLAYQVLGDREASEAASAQMVASQTLQKHMDQLITRAIKQPTDAEVREELAAVCEKLGMPAEATRWRQAAAALRRGAAKPTP
ncbi:MAG: tetratricopeptide repeat protein [Planctomycetales bacterium]